MNTYKVLLKCENCKEESESDIEKGVKITSKYLPCPFCGVDDTNFMYLIKAI